MNMNKLGLEIKKSAVAIENVTNLKDIKKSSDAIAENNVQKIVEENISNQEFLQKSLEI